jgi:hypothetical protein
MAFSSARFDVVEGAMAMALPQNCPLVDALPAEEDEAAK